MKYLFLFLFFIPGISVGEDDFSKADVKFLSIEKAMNSLVMVTVPSRFEQSASEAVGFIARDFEGNIGVITSFSFINRIVYINGEDSILVYNKANTFFKVEKIKNISLSNNLVFLKVKGDLTERGKWPPLSLADSYGQNEPFFYALRAKASSSRSWFQAEAIQGVVSFSNRLDFLIRTSYTNIKNTHKFTNIPVFNQKGEIVSFVSDGADYTLYGVPLKEIKVFLQSPENCAFIRGCVIEALKAFYKKALLWGDSQASYMLMLYTTDPVGTFEKFMHSIGITYSVSINTDLAFFMKDAAKWDAKFYYYWLINTEEMPKKKRKEHFEFLEQKSSVKSLAKEGHPHFQYLMGSVYLHLDKPSQAEYWFKKSAANGYMPGLWEEMKMRLDNGLNGLSALLKEDYTMARQVMVFLGQDFTDAISFIKLYSEQRSQSSALKAEHSQDVSTILEVELDTNQDSRFFKSLFHLGRGLDLLQQLAEQNFGPAEKLQRHFKRYVQEELTVQTYRLFRKSNEECKENFVNRFMTSVS